MSNNIKTWTINVQVNTKYIQSFSGKGSWGSPIGGNKYWKDNVTMTAVNDQDNEIFTGVADNFSLKIKPMDKVRWVLSEVNPLVESYVTLCMYGFQQGSNWDKCFTELSSTNQEMMTTTIRHWAFNNPDEPSRPFLRLREVDTSLPQTVARMSAKPGDSVTYYIRLLLIDSSTDHKNPEILKYVQVDPKLVIA